ncbi:Solute carrier family 22 member 18 [Myotis brandtii]|uniref:Solute carrier family 22 member 18 n=1 Tax=Myotis brandtii TaxID=109478 RepID=S7QFJ7_MYOBR|nr:Solute carrier family 22 member 18 [Myotis brandtii]
MLGLCASVQPLIRTLGPTLGGLLYRSFGVPVFGHVQFAVNLLVFLALWRQPTPQKTDKVR